ncbi:MAG: hypothetical protein LBU25_05685 [Treponema sp.]|nr:hypothetical protein [Treponema sp.]
MIPSLRCSMVFCILISMILPLEGQTYGSVPLDKSVYRILEQAALRGLCAPLSGAKPYSRNHILSGITEILDAESSPQGFGKLGDQERRILEDIRKIYAQEPPGLDWQRGTYRFEHSGRTGNLRFSGEAGLMVGSFFSLGLYPQEGDSSWGTDIWPGFFFNGDLGEHFSYRITAAGGMIRAPRSTLGTYNTYYQDFQDAAPSSYNQEIPVYSEPLAFFPYTYKPRWDGSVFNHSDISSAGYTSWPSGLSVGSAMLPELAGSLLDGHIRYRGGRLDREWGAMTEGSSLVLNRQASPFLALEATVNPFPWLYFSTLTGVLEYYNARGIKDSAATYQNAFSIAMVEINYRAYLHLDMGSAALWPKRFELGYLFPVTDNFFYQNTIGDFDNLAIFGSLKGQYPGIGSLWVSLFLDEVSLESGLLEKDRSMYAFQTGTTLVIPWLPFATLSLRYTKIEPYCYTHTRETVPWYGQNLMETAYINKGSGFGYYLPPNSDELLFRVETLWSSQAGVHLQYQMIRHGADYGSSAVDGSSFWSELDPHDRSTKPVLRKFFLRDGAYQWQHILKIGANYSFAQSPVPVQIFGEAGVVVSYFTNIAGPANSGSPSGYWVIDTAEYPRSIGLIASLGFRLFPGRAY